MPAVCGGGTDLSNGGDGRQLAALKWDIGHMRKTRSCNIEGRREAPRCRPSVWCSYRRYSERKVRCTCGTVSDRPTNDGFGPRVPKWFRRLRREAAPAIAHSDVRRAGEFAKTHRSNIPSNRLDLVVSDYRFFNGRAPIRQNSEASRIRLDGHV